MSRSASMLPPETTQTILPRPARPASAAATPQAPAPSAMTRARSATSRNAAQISSSVETSEPARSPCARASIWGNTERLPIPSTNVARCSTVHGRPSRKGRRQGSARLCLGGVDAARRRQGAKGGTDAAGKSAASPRNHHGCDVRQVLEDFEANGPVAGHHLKVIEGMDECGIDARVASVLEGLPPALERRLDDACAEALDRG